MAGAAAVRPDSKPGETAAAFSKIMDADVGQSEQLTISAAGHHIAVGG